MCETQEQLPGPDCLEGTRPYVKTSRRTVRQKNKEIMVSGPKKTSIAGPDRNCNKERMFKAQK